jgi:hypothetical protein
MEVRSGRNAVMPLAFLAMVGFALVVLLFSADATLEKITQLTNDRSIQAVVAAPAPAPNMTSQAALAAQLRAQREPEVLAKIEPEARAARAEALPKKKRVIPEQQQQQPVAHQQQFDRFSIKGY